jgi:tetratricopeptide (TPR) repeat protein
MLSSNHLANNSAEGGPSRQSLCAISFMNLNPFLKVILFTLLAGGVALSALCEPRSPIDQIPMYGGIDRNANPELKAGDESFISGVVAEFGSREKASAAFVNRGFALYQKNDLAGAMRRFNQAWLLNPSNPDVYWGFSTVFSDQEKFCEAVTMVDLAESKGILQPAFLPDAALIYTGCTVVNKTLAPELQNKYLRRSDDLFTQAFESPAVRKEYTLFHWARALYGRGDYIGAWDKVAQFRKETGREFDPRFIRSLSQKMPEPR